MTEDPGGEAGRVRVSEGQSAAPQIVFGQIHVGGCEDLERLGHEGRLMELLKPYSSGATAAASNL
mgnify:CR=1 FL=1